MTAPRPESDTSPLRDARDAVEERIDAVLDVLKPHLRGWLHLGMAPLALIAGMALIVLSDSLAARVTAAVFTFTAVNLFATSAIYHRGTWGPKMTAFLKRFDHANIFLIIAGTYTPFSLLLPADQRRTMLLIVWLGALAGVLFRVFWVGAPRWLYVPTYVALGFVAVFYLKPLLESGGGTLITLIAIGGVLYTAGAVVYGIKRPDPSPRWFGYHEIFHTLTILAFGAHFAAAWLALDRVA